MDLIYFIIILQKLNQMKLKLPPEEMCLEQIADNAFLKS